MVKVVLIMKKTIILLSNGFFVFFIRVKAILVNVFGGIVNCATIANGVVNACKALGLHLPLVVRLEGTNVEAAKKILADSGLPIQR